MNQINSNLPNWIISIILIVIGILIKWSLDYIKNPKLKIKKIADSYDNNLEGKDVKSYRVKVYNKQRLLFNDAAKNCTAWLDIDECQEPFQLCWLGGNTKMINVDDFAQIELCSINISDKSMIIPIVEKCYSPNAGIRDIKKIEGFLRVTSENAKADRVRICINSELPTPIEFNNCV